MLMFKRERASCFIQSIPFSIFKLLAENVYGEVRSVVSLAAAQVFRRDLSIFIFLLNSNVNKHDNTSHCIESTME